MPRSRPIAEGYACLCLPVYCFAAGGGATANLETELRIVFPTEVHGFVEVHYDGFKFAVSRTAFELAARAIAGHVSLPKLERGTFLKVISDDDPFS